MSVEDVLAAQGLPVASPPTGAAPPTRCPVLDWARSGAMSLTGPPDGPPAWPDGPVMGVVRSLVGVIGGLARIDGVDPGTLLTGRAAERGLRRRGQISAGGHCRLLEAADGWMALSLARATDAEALPALLEAPVQGGKWDAVCAAARHRHAAELVERAQLLGLPASVLTAGAVRPPVVARSLGHPSGAVERDRHTCRPVVVDLSAMWAGPLCAHLLWRSGARVIKVEDVGRPDGARAGDDGLFQRLHAGHEAVALDFATDAGRATLRALVAAADVVVESSRPRALRQLGLDAEASVASRPGRTWVSLTGYGREGGRENWVAFGDDAAVGGALVASDRAGRPVFCADAVADPLAGLFAAAAALGSLAAGGGHLLDVSLRDAAALAATGDPCPGNHRLTKTGAGTWAVAHDDTWAVVEPPKRPSAPQAPAPALGADTARVLAELGAPAGGVLG